MPIDDIREVEERSPAEELEKLMEQVKDLLNSLNKSSGKLITFH